MFINTIAFDIEYQTKCFVDFKKDCIFQVKHFTKQVLIE